MPIYPPSPKNKIEEFDRSKISITVGNEEVRQSTTTLVDKDDSPDKPKEDSVLIEIKGMYRDPVKYKARGD